MRPVDIEEKIEAIRIGVRIDEEQIRLLLSLLAPPGGGYHPDPLRSRTQMDLSIWLQIVCNQKRALRLDRLEGAIT